MASRSPSPSRTSKRTSELSLQSSASVDRGLNVNLRPTSSAFRSPNVRNPLRVVVADCSDSSPSPLPRAGSSCIVSSMEVTSPNREFLPEFPSSRRRSVDSSGMLSTTLEPAGWRCMVRVPLAAALAVVLCVFAVGPAMALWMISWRSGQRALGGLQNLAMSSVEDVSAQLRESLMTSVSFSLEGFVERAESAVDIITGEVEASGVLAQDGRTVGTSAAALERFGGVVFSALKTSPWMYYASLWLFSDVHEGSSVQRAIYFSRLNVYFVTREMVPTLYTLPVYPHGNGSAADYCLANTTTGQPTLCFQTLTSATPQQTAYVPERSYCEWNNAVSFLPFAGTPDNRLICWIPFLDGMASLSFRMSVNVFTISSMLLSLVPTPADRLFLTLRTSEGTLVGASHGKFFSHSDFDFTTNNPFKNPVPIEDFVLYSAVNSTDATIRACAYHVLKMYHDWASVAEMNNRLVLSDGTFWFRTEYIKSRYALKWQVFMLISTDSRIGPVLGNSAETAADLRRTNATLVVLLVIVVVAALAMAVLIAFVLSLPLVRLAKGMRGLVLLELEGDAHRTRKTPQLSMISEIQGCQRSFGAMQRGLEAFAKFVPRDVVKMMLSGVMSRKSLMTWRTVTLMFTDIVGFTSLCEAVPSEALVGLMADFFEAMCEEIVATGGLLDKFIGDCIMALWNVPTRLQGHQGAACRAALGMQASMVKLSTKWMLAGLPEVRFRTGINTASVLVGNYGCDYRISYTALGDGVNLASRLEASNKAFGTVALVSESTKDGAEAEFEFRMLGRILVPGKAEVVTVYELLCERDALPSTPPDTAALPESAPNSDFQDVMVMHHWALVRRDVLLRAVDLYEKGVTLYMNCDPRAAQPWFREALAVLPSDSPSKMLLEVCGNAVAMETPCDGVLRMSK